MKRNVISRARGAALVIAVSTLAAGCTAMSPVQTTKTMSLGDGVKVDLGEVQVRNLAVVSDEKGGPATVTGAVENSGDEPVTLTVSVGQGESVSAEVEPGTVVVLSGDGKKLTLPKVDAAPGDTTELQVGTSPSDAAPVSVPVLAPHNYYEEYAPEASPSA